MMQPISHLRFESVEPRPALPSLPPGAGEEASFENFLEQALKGGGPGAQGNLLGFNFSSSVPGLPSFPAGVGRSQESDAGAAVRLSREQMQSIYYGSGGAPRCSEKASEHGQFEISHFPVTTSAGGLVLNATNIYNHADQGGAEGAQVGVYDYDAILGLNGGRMPSSPEEMRQLLKEHPEVELKRYTIGQPPEILRVDGIPAGKRVVVGVGLGALEGGAGGRIQAMLSNFDDLPAATQGLVPPAARRPFEGLGFAASLPLPLLRG